MNGFNLDGGVVLTIVLVVEAIVILGFVARWYGRRWGWRNTFGRLRGYVRETVADLARPLLRWRRFSGDVRLVAHELTDPDLGDILRAATADVLGRSAGPDDLRCHAASSSSGVIALLPAAPEIPPTPIGFQDAHGWWTTDRSRIAPLPMAGSVGHVAVGTTRASVPGSTAVLFLNLWQAPGVIELSGPPRPVHSLLCAIGAQLLGGLAGSELDLIVTSGVHPKFRGPQLDTVLHQLQDRLDQPPAERMVVLVCGRMSAEQAQDLSRLVSALPELVVVTSGPYPGRRWKLPLDADGRLDAPDLGLVADSAPVEKAVAQVLARGPRRPRPAAPRRSTDRQPDHSSLAAAAPATGRPAPPPAASWAAPHAAVPDPAWESEETLSPAFPELADLTVEGDDWSRPQRTFSTADTGLDAAPPAPAAWPAPAPAPVWQVPAAQNWALDEPEPADDFVSGASAASTAAQPPHDRGHNPL